MRFGAADDNATDDVTGAGRRIFLIFVYFLGLTKRKSLLYCRLMNLTICFIIKIFTYEKFS